MNNELIVKNLNYKNLLTDINFTLKESTINIIMGKNGGGKTLLIKSLMGLVDYSGSVIINGVILTKENIEEYRKQFGVYLGLNSLEEKNVFLNIIDPLINLNYTEELAKKKVYHISKKLGIENLLYKEVSTLSYAQKKVISFVQSIIHEPKFILVDNLFDSLDNYYKDKIISYLNQMKKNKKSIIVIITNNSEDLLIADNLLIINNGKISADGEVLELLKDDHLFLKNNIKLPFLIDLSYKLKVYKLIDGLVYNIDEMVDEIWK